MGSRLRDTVRYLYELFCEVSPGDQMREPYIVRKYPETYKNEKELENVPKFTFPCQLDNTFVQLYSFVLTSMDSKYTFCFCRYDPRSNTSIVLLSHLPWHDIFYKLLNCIATLMNSTERNELNSFLEACRIRPPMPGHTLKITYNAGHNIFSCQCPDAKLPSIPDNGNLMEYFSAVDTKCMAGVWAALLHERRVAVVATKPSRLSACVQAANATLFPMSWQHIFIPILPKQLVDYLLAPMPFLIGVPRSVMQTVRMSEIGEVVILDVDKNELITPFHDLESLPSDLVVSLRKALSDKNALGDTVSRAFLRALVCLIGGYREAIRIEKGQRITFNPEAFVTTRKNMQPFLKKILQSQIFQQFIDERLDLLNSGRGLNDEFEMECNLYSEKLGTGSGQRLKQQYRDWAKTVKKEGGAFFKNVKEKANPAVQSAVKTVRQGGKNVKSAVKGLKNKMPKSRTSSINTTDDSRFSSSFRSETPVSSESSDSTSTPSNEPPKDPPLGLPLDLLTEMEYLFAKKNIHRRDSFPNTSHNTLSLPDKSKTLSPIPPRLPERPQPPLRYHIISTRKLIDISDAPAPPPRVTPAPTNTHFVSNITKNDVNATTSFHTSTICFTDGKDRPKLKLTLSTNQRKLPLTSVPYNGTVNTATAGTSSRQAQDIDRTMPTGTIRPPIGTPINGNIQESSGSGSDLIKLEDSPTSLDDFDPLKSRTKNDKEKVKSTDSALLHEYGLDFSQFGLIDYNASSSSLPEATCSVPKGWTTFN